MEGFPIQRKNRHGGYDVIPYAEATLSEIATALEAQGGHSPVTVMPDKVTKAGPKEHRQKLAAIYKDFMSAEKRCDEYSIGNASHWFDKWQKEAHESGEPGDAPADKNEVKDRMRNVRREIRSNFKAKHFRSYYSMVRDLLNAAIPALTKLIESENAQDIERNRAHGVEQKFAPPIGELCAGVSCISSIVLLLQFLSYGFRLVLWVYWHC